MRRSELPLFLALGAVLLAAAAYALVYFTARAEQPPTAVCTGETWQETLPLTGRVSRDEILLTVPGGTVYPLAAPGERIRGGEAAAFAADSGEAYFRAALLLRIRGELAALDAPAPDASAVRDLSLALARRDFSALRAALPLSRRALGRAATNGNALRQEVSELVLAGAEDGIVRAPCAGLLAVSEADGTLRVMSGSCWRFTAPLPDGYETAFPDGTAELLLPDGARAAAEVCVHGGTAVFTCRAHPESILSPEECTLTVLFEEITGLCVPEEALSQSEDGFTVCRVSGPLRETVPVTVLARRNGAALVTGGSLREGSAVLLGPQETEDPEQLSRTFQKVSQGLRPQA